MAKLSAYYPNPIIAGTTAGTYADGGSAAFRDQSFPFTANQILSGTANTAPNQTAASASSLLTRQLFDLRSIWLPVNTIHLPLNYMTGSTSGSAQFLSAPQTILQSLTTANSGVTAVLGNGGNLIVGSGFNGTTRWTIVLRAQIASNTGTFTTRRISVDQSSTGVQPVTWSSSVWGFGVDFLNGNATCWACNGTTYTAQTPVAVSAFGSLLIRCDAANSVSFIAVNGSTLTTLGTITFPGAGNPTAQNIKASCLNSGTGEQQAMFFYSGSQIVNETNLQAIAS